MLTENPSETIYLQRVELSEICFLQEVLYWVAFGRLPILDLQRDGGDIRLFVEGYKTDIPYADDSLFDEECERAELPPDPRNKYDWASNVWLRDDLDTIRASGAEYVDSYNAGYNAAIATARTELPEGVEQGEANKEQVLGEAAKLHKELSEWKPEYKRAIELAVSQIYTALRKGDLTSEGKRLPDPDPAVSLKVLAEQGKQFGDLEDVPILKDAWSLSSIYWGISAARSYSGSEH